MVKIKTKRKKGTKLGEWQKNSNNPGNVCAKCGGSMGLLTVDHIIPASLIDCLLANPSDAIFNLEENYQLLCRYCNRLKGSKLDVRNPKTFAILDKLIAQSKLENNYK